MGKYEKKLYELEVKKLQAQDKAWEELKAQQEAKKNIGAEEKLAQKRISAADAKAISESTLVPLTRIYKAIRENAAEGLNAIYYCIQDWSSSTKDKVKKDLTNSGYELTEIDGSTLKISW